MGCGTSCVPSFLHQEIRIEPGKKTPRPGKWKRQSDSLFLGFSFAFLPHSEVPHLKLMDEILHWLNSSTLEVMLSVFLYTLPKYRRTVKGLPASHLFAKSISQPLPFSSHQLQICSETTPALQSKRSSTPIVSIIYGAAGAVLISSTAWIGAWAGVG